MATHFRLSYPRAVARTASVSPSSLPYCRKLDYPFAVFTSGSCYDSKDLLHSKGKIIRVSRIGAVNGRGESYLDMWKKAKERERKSAEFERMAEIFSQESGDSKEEEGGEESERRTSEFEKLLEVSVEERDKVQRMQVIDRAAAAIAAAKALIKDKVQPQEEVSCEVKSGNGVEDDLNQEKGVRNGSSLLPPSLSLDVGTPGPSFWTWAPPPDDDSGGGGGLKLSGQMFPTSTQSIPVLDKALSYEFFSIPFESSTSQTKQGSSLPPFQSSMDADAPSLDELHEIDVQFSAQATEAARALNESNKASSQGITSDESKWWKETGVERRPNGVLCKWTLIRVVSADQFVEWEDKYWEAADEFGYKELGSEKSGRDAAGNVWREYWKETMSQIGGNVHLEKTADKWGKNDQGSEWQEKWWEHYGAGKTEKSADKWCRIDPNTPLDPGHAHVWHERWGEVYDGLGGSMKFSDKWAERFEGDGWSKWGDKWDENFDLNGNGVKQGEKWWQGRLGDSWNRTWGEGHNGSGWVHKYGKSSSGEHWDTHVLQETWYERFPHYGFYHCFGNSVQLRQVKKPSQWTGESL